MLHHGATERTEKKQNAVTRVYGNVYPGREAKEFLPPVSEVLRQIPNPAVMRSLSELRKVVNAIVRRYKKPPAQIRIELARSLKRNAEQRQQDLKANRSREKERRWAGDILRELGQRASRDAVDRILLDRQCKGVCVYCGQSLGAGSGAYADLFNDVSAIEMEHILPRRCLDNSCSNKVLAHHACNSRKGDRTPYQAFGEEPGWEQMLARVAGLDDPGKLQRFKIVSEEQLQEFSSRHLADTRYATRLAAEYVGQLYGGGDAATSSHDGNQRRVYASSGALTAMLRRGWALEAILKEPASAANGQGGKTRTDHRHHAVDAIVIALTSEAMVQQAARAAQQHDRSHGHLLPRYFPPPWPVAGEIRDRVELFKDSIDRVIQTITVSHRVDHKLNGPLHQATFYSPRTSDNNVFTRTPVQSLTVKDIDSSEVIPNERVRNAIRQKLREVGGDPKKLESSLPILETRKGPVKIRYVRVRVPGAKAIPVRNGEGQPAVFTEGNHHISIFSWEDPKKGRIWYTPGPVSRMEAMRRKSAGREVVETSDGATSTFIFSLMKGDMVEILDQTGTRDLFVLVSLSEGDYELVRHTKTSVSTLRKKFLGQGQRIRIRNIDELRRRDCRKVEIDPLGAGPLSSFGQKVSGGCR